MKSNLLAGAACLALFPAALHAQVDVGPEFQVNVVTTGHQSNPAVATDAHGNFVVVWADPAAGIVGRRYTAAGVPRGGEFLVQASTTGSYPGLPRVASSTDGSFVVVWHSAGDGNGYGVFGRRFDASGAPAGGAFTVNSYTTHNQAVPSVASDANGNFVVVWQSAGQDGISSTEYGVFAQRFDAAGARLGGEFLVNSVTAGFYGSQGSPSVDADLSGNFIVVWAGRYVTFGPTIINRLAGQRFDSAGAKQGDSFFVDSSTAGSKGSPRVARDEAGHFMVVWSSSSGFPIPTGSVIGRAFDPTALPFGPEFVVNSYLTGLQGGAAIDSDRNGNFVVTWQSNGQEGPQFESGIYFQSFDATGARVLNEFIVNAYTPGSQRSAAVASSPDENFVVIWEGDQAGAFDIYGQRFGDLIFREGFQTGNLARWSSTSTDGGDLSVSPGAALAGTSAGLAALVDDTSPLFVQDDTPTAEERYRGRFYFDPNDFDPGVAQSHLRTRIFIAFDTAGRRSAALVLRLRDGEYSLMGRVRLDDGTRVDTGFVPITNAPHLVEFDWRRASAPGAGDGLFRLFIDEADVATLIGLDNDDGAIERARLGALSVKSGAAGTLLYDQFVSRRQSFIGPFIGAE